MAKAAARIAQGCGEPPFLPAAVLAGHARMLAETHEPGGLYAFETLYPAGDVLGCGTHAAIDPRFDPAGIPSLIIKMTRRELTNLDDGSPMVPCAFALLIESLEGGGAFGRRECVRATVCDIHGRTWQAVRDPAAGTVTERHAGPGEEWIGNPLDAVLLSIARSTGIFSWGLRPGDGAEADALRRATRG
jgi:hypothetical protein